MRYQDSNDVAIVGIGCRYPGGIGSADDLWQFVSSGNHVSSDFPPDRPMPEMIGVAAPEAIASFAPKGGFIDSPGAFDAEFFGISPREAKAMDPQQRVSLELCWESLEHAGIDPHALRGSRTGVYIGAMTGDYAYLAVGRQDLDPGYIATGASQSVLSGRISYLFGLEGPSMTIDTACSSSLVALHIAAQAVRAGECSLALVGGVTIMSTLTSFYALGQHGAVSRDGLSKPFSSDADGFCVSEGGAILVVERLADAVRHRHHVLGIVRGSAVNQDGASNGLTAPSAPAQIKLIQDALASAGLTASDVDVVEGHGTGTPVGDPLELEALLATYGQRSTQQVPLFLGSIKSNFGHAQAAAGAAGVIKMVQSMRQGFVPASLNVSAPTASVDWSAGAVEVVTEEKAWPDSGRPRRCGISSFGISGTNAHVILEQAPTDLYVQGEPNAALLQSDHTIWTVSGRTAAARAEQAGNLLAYLETHPELDHRGIGRALATRRAAFEYRAAVVGADRATLEAELARIADDQLVGCISGNALEHKVVFVFPGQGGQYPGMGAQLMRESEVFAEHIRACDEALSEFVDWSVADTLLGAEGCADMSRVDVIQPLLFAVMTGLAAVWRSIGVQPDAVIGHSQGEIAAAYVAGVLSLSDAARIIALRSIAIRPLAGTGTMASISLAADQFGELLAGLDDICVAAVNSTRTTVVSGGTAQIETLEQRCEAAGVRYRRIDVDIAGHSAHFDALADEVAAVAAPVTAHPSDITIFSTVTGDVIAPAELGPDYWFRNMRDTVLFNDAVEAAFSSGFTAFLEMRPQPVLTAAMYETFEDLGVDNDLVFAVSSATREDDGVHGFLTAVANAYVHGVLPDWDSIFAGIDLTTSALPGYAFQRANYWLSGGGAMRGGQPSAFGLTDPEHPLLGAITEVPAADRYYFSTRVAVSDYPWIADHALNGNVLVPGAMLLELALQAGHKLGSPRVDKLTMHTPVSVPASGAVQVQLIIGAAKRGQRPVSIYSRLEPEKSSAAGQPYTLHADGVLTAAPEALPEQGSDFWPPAGAKPALDITEAYRALSLLGYQYGPVFQGMKNVWRRGEEVFAEVALPESVGDADKYGLHPALLDAAMQTIVAVAEFTGLNGLALPYKWENVALFAVGARALRVRLTAAGNDRVAWLLTDSGGRLVATGVLQLRAVALDKLAERGLTEKRESLFHIDWMRVTLPAGRYAAEGGQWAVIGGPSSAKWLPELGSEPIYPDLTTLLDATNAGAPVPKVVVWAPVQQQAESGVRDRLVATLAQLQHWLVDDATSGTKLVIVAHGTQTLDNAGDIADPDGAAVWGLARSIQSENPDRITQIDIGADISLDALAQAVGSDEPELLYRRGEFYGRRVRADLAQVVRNGELLRAPWVLSLPGSGNLEDATLVTDDSRTEDPVLEPGMVEVQLRAAGISFPMVLQGVAAAKGAPPRVCHEGSGVVRAVGPDVTGFAVGDHVFGLFDGIRSTAVTDHRLLAAKPSTWSFAEAACAPVSYLTAARALELAGAQPGESVLVHSAAGGVGLAATHLARRAGLTVFGTASAGKWNALTDRGFTAEQLADSRSEQFVAAFTDHGGFDIVLNTLADEFTDASLSLLKDGGQFIEVGRVRVLDSDEVTARRPGVGYSTFELYDVAPEQVHGLLGDLAAAAERDELPALPLTCFDIRQAGAALRFVSEAHRVGKVALTWPAAFDPDKTVLITGGTGAIGRMVARHLVTAFGARHLLLMSRTGPATDGMDAFRDELAAEGVTVDVVACDVADAEALADVLAGLPQQHPLGAVLHLAATLDDATLQSLTPEHIESVLPAKVDGAVHLDRLTAGLDLSMFVLFSSAAGTFGAPGQANYAAANTYIDALAQRRYHRGLPATALAWGWWSEVSANTSTLDEKDRARLTRIGIVPMRTDDALAMFDAAIDSGLPHVVPIGMNLGLLRAAAAVTELPPLFRAVLHLRPRATTQMGDANELTKRLIGLDPAQQHSFMVDMLAVPIAMVLGFSSPTEVTADREFHEMGIDSLSSIELGTHLRAITGLKLSNSVIFEYPTVSLLARHVLTQLAPADADRADPIIAELEVLLDRLSDIHAEDPLPGELISRLNRSMQWLSGSEAPLLVQSESATV